MNIVLHVGGWEGENNSPPPVSFLFWVRLVWPNPNVWAAFGQDKKNSLAQTKKQRELSAQPFWAKFGLVSWASPTQPIYIKNSEKILKKIC